MSIFINQPFTVTAETVDGPVGQAQGNYKFEILDITGTLVQSMDSPNPIAQFAPISTAGTYTATVQATDGNTLAIGPLGTKVFDVVAGIALQVVQNVTITQ